MTHSDERTINDYGLSQQELNVQETAPLFNEDEFAALFSFDPEELGLDRFCRTSAEPHSRIYN